MTADLYEPYLIALDVLLERLGRDQASAADALVYQQRLQENIERTRRYGDNENRRSERSEIIELLNRLSNEALGVDFNTLVRQARPKPEQDGDRAPPRKPFEPETVLIRGGPFPMGSDDPTLPAWERPQHTVDLHDFRIGRYPVTNREYAAFIKDNKAQPAPQGWFNREPPPDRLDHPVVNVSWYDALAFCAWLSAQTGRGYTLPSEAEWEKAGCNSFSRSAGQGTAEVATTNRYPWGDTLDAARVNAGSSGTTPVMAYPAGASAYGVEDLLGNVQEWTRSLWGSQPAQPDFGYPYRPDDGREITAPDHLPAQARLVHRGGSFKSQLADLRSSARGNALPDSKIAWRGLRVAMHDA
ncbi:formylglycine-generating enzyme family protein [Candidatus Amarolinea aalborgensis]|uniref:formylglycine-generating enzyme family protein n=1 Tax=Candidatus Amarolinea aalborgensis TaxID=2249329 RepID=UPI003BF975D2